MRAYIQIILLSAVGLLAGCATYTYTPMSYVSAIQDPKYNPTLQSRIAVLLDDNASIEDRQFGAFLVSQLLTNGFDVVAIPDSDFVLAYSTKEDASQATINLPYSTPTTTYGNVGGTGYSETSDSTTWIPTSFSYTIKGIWLDAYATPDIRAGKMKTVWEGYISVGAYDFQRDPASVVRTLLLYFGRDFKGPIPLVQKQ
jgi:hypothetical protein